MIFLRNPRFFLGNPRIFLGNPRIFLGNPRKGAARPADPRFLIVIFVPELFRKLREAHKKNSHLRMVLNARKTKENLAKPSKT